MVTRGDSRARAAARLRETDEIRQRAAPVARALRELAQELEAQLQRPPGDPPEQLGRLLAAIPQGGGSEIRIAWREFEDGRRPVVGFQIWSQTIDGVNRPLRFRGFEVACHLLPKFAEGLAVALAVARQRVIDQHG